ncbi:MAG TPA: tellurite resistance/C4-dicarboxylate transporter family protein, partial [Micromonosporaceae bacterium]
WLSLTLLWIACVALVILIVLNIWRLVAFGADVLADARDPRRAFAMFTFVAGIDVVGTRLVPTGHRTTALVLLAVGSVAWLLLGYVVPWMALLGSARRPILRDANGSWFVWVVASQSVAVLAATLEPIVTSGRNELAFLAVISWSVGVFLYGGTGLFVAARLLSYPLRPSDLTPPFWVAMGATAITVVAGAKIVQMAPAPAASAAHELAAGLSIAFWAFGTWLIPALIAAGIWRHIIHRVPLRYEPALWSIVFPVGMYGVGCRYLGAADHLPGLDTLGAVESWIAVAVWLVTFVAMLAHLARTITQPAQAVSTGQPANGGT